MKRRIVFGLAVLAVSAVSPAAATATAMTATATTATATTATATATSTSAGWTGPTAIQPGVSPVLSFGPSGAAALGSQLVHGGRVGGSEIDIANPQGSFGASPLKLTAPSAGQGPEPLTGLTLGADYLAASFAPAAGRGPVLTSVAVPGSTSFSATQTLVPFSVGGTTNAAHASQRALATTDGEIVSAGADAAGRLYTASLAAHGNRFVSRRAPGPLASTDDYGLASDTNGGTYLAGDGANACTAVAFRPAHESFRLTYQTGNCRSGTPNVFDAIAATGHGGAGLLTEDISLTGSTANRLLVQVGRDGHFGHATQLGGVLGPTVGLAADADGELTAEWSDCQSGAVGNGQLATVACGIDAATGSVTAGFSAAKARGTRLVKPAPGVTLTALTADRGILVSRCAHSGCGLIAFTARPGGGFRDGLRLARAGRLITFTGDDNGDLLAVWRDPQGRLYGATGSAASGRWSPDHLLSSRAVSAADVSAAYGPRQRAIVAWSRAGETDAASYSAGG